MHGTMDKHYVQMFSKYRAHVWRNTDHTERNKPFVNAVLRIPHFGQTLNFREKRDSARRIIYIIEDISTTEIQNLEAMIKYPMRRKRKIFFFSLIFYFISLFLFFF